MKEESVIAEIREKLSSQFDIEQIILFGSRATGTHTHDSDWDILVIARSSLPFIERQGMAMSVVGPHDFPLDLLVYTPEEAAKAGAVPGSVVYWARREGRGVYAK